jgi:hypothetical protein
MYNNKPAGPARSGGRVALKSRRKKKPDLLIGLVIAVAVALAATLVLQVNAQAGVDTPGVAPLFPYLSGSARR